MPLSKEYFDIIKSGDSPLNAPSGAVTDRRASALYPDLSASLTDVGGGSALDFLGSALWGGVSGLTWGLSEFAVPSTPWEEMNAAERSGWILGEGASLFAPWGPFGLMGKGARVAVKGQNKFIGAATKAAAKEAKDVAVAGTAHLTKKEAKHVIKAIGKGSQFTDDIYKGLDKVAADDLGVRWIKDLKSTGTGTFIYSLNNELLKRGHDVDIFTFNNGLIGSRLPNLITLPTVVK